ncbi:hypothetical protein RhiirC2_784443 [Rhizophagus irregularis]|uniref:Protein kinase domain-containing protein n=1 Tax=Rhizophagus irregularis TaxID=588596 RepID=A0A2N1MYH5_9GLOM|nr:hypothetical protein RhiirC2_784443 [Rhizophagus irregularis]
MAIGYHALQPSKIILPQSPLRTIIIVDLSYNHLKYLKENFTNWTSGNEQIDDFIQERQLNINSYNDVVFEWIPYNQFNEIKETGKNGSIIVYSAIWRNGQLYRQINNYIRDSNKVVALKCLHNLQNPVDSLINEAKKYSTKNDKFHILYGISQNPDTSDYILVQNNSTNLVNWMIGNEKIDEFIQERQLNINSYIDVVFEWIPYNQFNEIKETGKNGSITVYSAIWKNGPLYKENWRINNYIRDSNKVVALKCLHNLQNPVDSLINEAKKYSTKNKFHVLYGISQNPNTSDYILVQKIILVFFTPGDIPPMKRVVNFSISEPRAAIGDIPPT